MTNKTKLSGTKTEQNLINAFAGESQARNKYHFFAKVAKEEGYEQIAAIFEETSENEKEHAWRFYEQLGDLKGTVNASYPFSYGTTEENLANAVSGEREEWEFLYAKGEKEAKEEGFEDIAEIFRHVREAENHHESRYKKLLENVKNGTVFKKDVETNWMCRECGYVLKGKEAPKKCPNCEHPQAYFQVLCENY